MSKKYDFRTLSQHQRKKSFPAFVTITETVAAEEIETKNGCVKRRAYAKQVRIAQGSRQKMLPKK